MKREVTKDEFLKKRMERRKKIRKRRLTAFFIFFILLLLCVGATLSLTVFFPIENLTAAGSKIYSSAEIIKASQISKGDNLFMANRARTEKALKTKLPFVESVSFKRELPGTLKITVKDATEFACYKVKDKYYTVSAFGWVLEQNYEQPDGLLSINAEKVKCQVGNEIVFEDKSQKELIDSIISALKTEKINANAIDITDIVSINIKVDNRFDVNLGTSNDIPKKLSHLAGMIEKIPKEKSGKINLSMWTSDNTRGTFTVENQ